MQPISLELPDELNKHTNEGDVAGSPAFRINTYRQLMDQVAELSFSHKRLLLFFRGQGKDYQNKAGSSSFYPTIYRGDYVTKDELKYRFRVLDECCHQLKDIFINNQLDGKDEVFRKRYIQWSILQHYEVCDTPLLDFTHSLRVACSFAQLSVLDKPQKHAYVYVFGLPYLSNRISINSEDDLVNVRLLSICPPQAIRPYFQDGYLCGTTDVTWDYLDKMELDFNLRLIAKFGIPKYTKFWGDGFQRIPKSVLYPKIDNVKNLVKEILTRAQEEILSDELGSFIRDWAKLEQVITMQAQDYDPKVQSALNAIKVGQKYGFITNKAADEINSIRKFRNVAVHYPDRVESKEIISMKDRIQRVYDYISF